MHVYMGNYRFILACNNIFGASKSRQLLFAIYKVFMHALVHKKTLYIKQILHILLV